MAFDIVDDGGHDLFRDAPFGLERETAAGADTGCVGFGPFEILVAADDDFQLGSPAERFVDGRLSALGRETHPVEAPAERVSSSSG